MPATEKDSSGKGDADMRKWGLPYMGSKSRLAERFIDFFPRRKNFYDLFCGGGAVTHCALESGKFLSVRANDLDPLCREYFLGAMTGRFDGDDRWISREDFFRLRDMDPVVRWCWSFGNDGRTYCYGKNVEPFKRAWHEALYHRGYGEMRREFGIDLSGTDGIEDMYGRYIAQKHVIEDARNGGKRMKMQVNTCMTSLGRICLENFERTRKFPSGAVAESFRYTTGSYDDVRIEPDSLIYCDIPYEGTKKYAVQKERGFDFGKFCLWCGEQTEPVAVSSYEMPEGFIPVFEAAHTSSVCADKTLRVTERLFVPVHQKRMWDFLTGNGAPPGVQAELDFGIVC